MIQFDRDVCNDLEQALSREWLETNGLGGFASSTIAGANTRRYHALLTASLRPPVERFVLLSKVEETLVVGDERFDLSTNEYQGAVHPRGFALQTGFRLDPWPVFTYAAAGVVIEKSVFMVHGSNTTVISYALLRNDSGRVVHLDVRPLIGFRDYHSLTHENGSLDRAVDQQSKLVSVRPYASLPPLFLAHNAAEVSASGYWYRNFQYRVEEERGLDHIEDLFNPLAFTFTLKRGEDATLIASTERHDVRDAQWYRESERLRRRTIADAAPRDAFSRALAVAADHYIVRRDSGYSVIAGYPWFTDWGRDTMIALPGLTLFSNKAEVCRDVLATFARHVDMGMLPNRFPDAGESPEFNTVDATLWFFEASRAYAHHTGDYEFIRKELYPVLSSIIDWHVRGTRYDIHMLDSGLLRAGVPGVQLTWMDAKIGDWVVTPRDGCAVEIQALWYNALRTMQHFADRLGQRNEAKRYATLASLARESFNRVFWNDKAGCLFDTVNGSAADATIRPNQVFSASLHFPILAAPRTKLMLSVVERELLTPYGLRTLAPGDSRYAPHYAGSPQQRDAVYHQGTVWPWLLGAYLTASAKAYGHSHRQAEKLSNHVRALEAHLSEAGLGHVSEIFDADPPHTPRGCFAQAWSVAELLRSVQEDIYAVDSEGMATLAGAEA